MLLRVCKFDCDQSVIYVSLFEEPFAFRTVYRIVLVGFSYIFLNRIVQSFATIAVCFDNDGSIINGTAPEQTCKFSAVYRFQFEGCP